METKVPTPRLTLQGTITCPHCWERFPPEESLWVAEHPDLIGDVRLGANFAQRFLPSRFTVTGNAIDPRGAACNRMACPACHLEIARPLYQLPPRFFSIIGAPACGKSYFLASMTWRLRQVLPQLFAITMNDADPLANLRLHEYEEVHFLNPNPDQFVSIAKTQTEGDMYDTVSYGDHTKLHPRPFLFTLQPNASHIHYENSQRVSKVICLYDNAGESFLPGQDTAAHPVTRHLAVSHCLFFLFDPTQDPRIRQACAGKSADPQMRTRSERLEREAVVRQDTVLLEMIHRIRRHAGLREGELHQWPLVIVVTKWDSWQSVVPELDPSPPYSLDRQLNMHVIDLKRIAHASRVVGNLFRRLTPELVAAGEGFAKDVIFIPVSATGRSPEVDPTTGSLGIRPRDMNPYWAEVPFLLAINRWCKGLIGEC